MTGSPHVKKIATKPPVERVPPPRIAAIFRRPGSTVVDAVVVPDLRVVTVPPPRARTSTALLVTVGGVLLALGIGGVMYFKSSARHELNSATLATQREISELLAAGDYPNAFQKLTRMEASLKNERGEWRSSAAQQAVGAEYEKLSQWMLATFRAESQLERDVVHALLTFDPTGGTGGATGVRYTSVRVNDNVLTLGAVRANTAAAAPSVVATAPVPKAALEPPPTDPEHAGTRSLTQAALTQRPEDNDSRLIADALFHSFPSLERIEIAWTGPNGETLPAFTLAQNEAAH